MLRQLKVKNQSEQMHLFREVTPECRTMALSFVRATCIPTPVEEVTQRGGAAVRRDAMLRALREAPYVAMMSCGRVRVLLLLLRDATVIGAPARCLFVDPVRGAVVSTRMVFAETLFERGGTVLEGEIVEATGSEVILFLVDDVLLLHGQARRPEDGFMQRRGMIAREIMERGYVFDPIFDDIQLVVKRLCLPHDLSPFLDASHRLAHPPRFVTLRPCCDRGGLSAFRVALEEGVHQRLHQRPHQRPSSTPLQEQLVPEPQQQTADRPRTTHIRPRSRVMSVRRTDLPDVYEVWDGIAWTLACLPTLSTSRAMRALLAASTSVVRMRCTFNVAFRGWEPTPISFPQTEETKDGGRTIDTPTQ